MAQLPRGASGLGGGDGGGGGGGGGRGDGDGGGGDGGDGEGVGGEGNRSGVSASSELLVRALPSSPLAASPRVSGVRAFGSALPASDASPGTSTATSRTADAVGMWTRTAAPTQIWKCADDASATSARAAHRPPRPISKSHESIVSRRQRARGKGSRFTRGWSHRSVLHEHLPKLLLLCAAVTRVPAFRRSLLSVLPHVGM